MAPRKQVKTQEYKRTLEDQVDMITNIRMRRWCKSTVNGIVKEYGDPNVFDEKNPHIVEIGYAEAAKHFGLEVNQKTGALVFDGRDVEGTDDATWNKAPAPGVHPDAVRLELLRIRAAAVSVRVPDSNDMDDYERMILEAEALSKGQQLPPQNRITTVSSREMTALALESKALVPQGMQPTGKAID